MGERHQKHEDRTDSVFQTQIHYAAGDYDGGRADYCQQQYVQSAAKCAAGKQRNANSGQRPDQNFKNQAQSSTGETDLARARRKFAQDQRVQAEETASQAQRVQTEGQAPQSQRVEADATEPANLQEINLDPDGVRDNEICMPGLQVVYPSNSEDAGQARPVVIIQDCDDPSHSTRAAQRHRLLTTVEMTSSCPSAKQAAARRYPLQFLVDMAVAVLDDETGELLEYRHLIQCPKYKKDWGNSFGNEVGRLAQGIPGRNTGTNTIYFIYKHDIPQDRWKYVTSGRIVCNVRPQIEEVFRMRLTVDGSRINIDMDCGTPTASLLTVKLLLNNVISTDGAKFMSIDIKDFYLNTSIDRPEFLRMNIKNFPDDVIKHYNLLDKVDAKGNLYIKCVSGMYGLPHAGIIAQRLLEERLNKAGYYQSDQTSGFWKHKWRPVSFSLIVDDFGVKYVGKEHAQHLMETLREFCTITEDWKGEKYIGIMLDWDYVRRQVHLSTLGYSKEALVRVRYDLRKINDQPHKHLIPNYGAKVQFATKEDTTPAVGKEEQTFIQHVTGTFQYYTRPVDPPMVVALSAIAAEQSKPTERTLEKTLYFLDYVASHPNAILTHNKSSMVLAVHSDASHLSAPNARSRAGGHFYMSNNDEEPPNNGSVHNIAQIIKNVMTLAADAEIGALYINSRQAIPARQLLEEMGHTQPLTPVQTDNTTALGFVTKNLNQKSAKSKEMNYWFMRDRQDRKQFWYY